MKQMDDNIGRAGLVTTLLPGGVVWTPTRYRIELTAEQIASMGAKVQPNQSFEEIDVTKFVRKGRLIIR